MVLNALVPTNVRSSILAGIERITQRTTDFIRGNPIVSTAAIGIGTTGLITAVAVVRRKAKKKRKTAIRRKARKKTTRRKPVKKKRRTHASPRHKGHKRVSFINKKTGKRVSFLVRKKGRPSHRRRKSKK